MNMGYVPDNHSVYEKLTGREYVNYVADLYRVSKADRTERLDKYLDLFKLGFATRQADQGLSHGMKQRSASSRRSSTSRSWWVLDEPMIGLDPQSTAEIIAYMREHCAKGNTVFSPATTSTLVKRLCHRVAIINEGHLIDCSRLAGHEENKANLEERFFKITGTYESACSRTMSAQEQEEMRPDMPVEGRAAYGRVCRTRRRRRRGGLSNERQDFLAQRTFADKAGDARAVRFQDRYVPKAKAGKALSILFTLAYTRYW